MVGGENREKNLEDVKRLIDTAFHDLELLRSKDTENEQASNRVYIIRLEAELRAAMNGLP